MPPRPRRDRGEPAMEEIMKSRRQFLTGLAAVGAAACSSGTGQTAQDAPAQNPGDQIPESGNQGRISVHHHYAPPLWVKVLTEQNALRDRWKEWKPSDAVEAMDKAGVRTSLSSITVPGIYFWEGFGNQQAPAGSKFKNDVAAMARDANEFGAKMKADYPGRFGIWASLPLPLIDESLKEIEYALDTLKLDGIGLLTSIGSKYLGDLSFTPVFEELNRRKAVVYTHPGAAPCCLSLIPNVGPTTLEYSQDTTRTIVSWIESGQAEKFPDVGWIFSHHGGDIWSQRFINSEYGTSRKAFEHPEKPPQRLSLLRKYYYDTAASDNWFQMRTLKELVGVSQVVLGDDHPYGEPLTYVKALKELANDGTFTVQDVNAILRDNMLRFMPQLKQYQTQPT
jgi:predicted TIM-barrel fold metal-dependent hydrolase